MAKYISLSPPHAHRWLYCLASPHVEADYPIVKTKYAIEGDVAHALLDKCFTEQISPFSLVGSKIEAGFKKELGLITQEIAADVNEVIEYIMGVKYRCSGNVYSEDRVKLDFIKEGQTGVIDIAIPDTYTSTLHIMDLKYGKGTLVEAFWNKQLLIYAEGALQKYTMLYPPFTNVVIHILQPRRDHYDSWAISRRELKDWIDGEVVPKAVYIKNNKGENIPRNPSEEACKFCRAKGDCRALADKALGIVADGASVSKPIKDDIKDTGKLDIIEVFHCLDAVDMIKSWCDAIKDKATEYLKYGMADESSGYKLVPGRTNRVWSDPERAEKALARAGLKREERLKSTLISPAQAEKILGKKNDIVHRYAVKPEGALTIAKLKDERNGVDLFEGFEAKTD